MLRWVVGTDLPDYTEALQNKSVFLTATHNESLKPHTLNCLHDSECIGQKQQKEVAKNLSASCLNRNHR
jgi:hypothetical protein